MDSIKLPESELSDMRQFYQEELDKTLKRLNHIKSVLEQLGDQSIQINISGNAGTTTAAKAPKSLAKSAVATRVRKGKRGPKPFWEDLIVKRLTQLDKPMTYDELTDDLIISTGRSMEKRDAIRQAIVNVVFRLRKEKRKLETITNGSREAYVVLKRWFEEDGKLKAPYQLRLAAEAESRKAAVVKVEKPKGKRGRPPKNATTAAVKVASPKAKVAAPKVKAVAPKAAKAPVKAVAKTPVKAKAAKTASKTPVKAATKTPVKAAAKPVVKAKAPAKVTATAKVTAPAKAKAGAKPAVKRVAKPKGTK